MLRSIGRAPGRGRGRRRRRKSLRAPAAEAPPRRPGVGIDAASARYRNRRKTANNGRKPKGAFVPPWKPFRPALILVRLGWNLRGATWCRRRRCRPLPGTHCGEIVPVGGDLTAGRRLWSAQAREGFETGTMTANCGTRAATQSSSPSLPGSRHRQRTIAPRRRRDRRHSLRPSRQRRGAIEPVRSGSPAALWRLARPRARGDLLAGHRARVADAVAVARAASDRRGCDRSERRWSPAPARW